MSKWVGKLSFICTGIGFIVAGVYFPEIIPTWMNVVFGLVGGGLVYLGGWFRKPEAP